MVRYKDDSYQRVNFHTNAVQFIVNGIKKLVKREAGKGARDYAAQAGPARPINTAGTGGAGLTRWAR